MTAARVCKDCAAAAAVVARPRPAPYPGPRCATHHREARKRAQQAARTARWARVYTLTAEQYAELYAAQGGRCAVCQRATGATRALAVDHDHRCCPGPTSCGRCIRGLVCSVCNRTLGHLRDSPALFRAAADYLEHPPARSLFAVASL